MKRSALIMNIVPAEGRTRGYLVAMDSAAVVHYFYDPQWKAKFPELKEGERIEIAYESTPNRGGWYLVEKG